MQDVNSPYVTVRRLATILMVAGLVGGAAMVGVGVWWLARGDAAWTLSGTALAFAGGWGMLIAVLLRGITAALAKLNEQLYRLHDTTLDLVDQVKAYRKPVDAMVANSEISDVAKSIAHRAKEREALRVAIREEISVEDWDLAYSLLDEMERRFGDSKETTSLRKQVDAARHEHMEERISEAVKMVGAHCSAGDWDRAHAEAARMQHLFPDDERMQRLPDTVDARLAAYKQSLLDEWAEAVKRKDIDGGIDILRALDPYLSAEEAKQLEVSARGVFHEKLMNMRVQFSLAVKEKRWSDAIQVGETIVGEFPNSRMAKEVGDTMEALRARADGKDAPAGDAKHEETGVQ